MNTVTISIEEYDKLREIRAFFDQKVEENKKEQEDLFELWKDHEKQRIKNGELLSIIVHSRWNEHEIASSSPYVGGTIHYKGHNELVDIYVDDIKDLPSFKFKKATDVILKNIKLKEKIEEHNSSLFKRIFKIKL